VPPAASFLQKARQKSLNNGFMRIIFFHGPPRAREGGARPCESYSHIPESSLESSRTLSFKKGSRKILLVSYLLDKSQFLFIISQRISFSNRKTAGKPAVLLFHSYSYSAGYSITIFSPSRLADSTAATQAQTVAIPCQEETGKGVPLSRAVTKSLSSSSVL